MQPLKDKWIVITRPEHQAHHLQEMLEAAGAKVILFPLLEIKPVDGIALMQQKLSQLADYDLAVFISPNAVEYTLNNIDPKLLGSLKIAAIGKKTKALLDSKGIHVDFYPEGVSNSETFLALPELINFSKNKKIVILRGNGGRELIRKTLEKSAKAVSYINVYQRQCPHNDLKLLSNHHDKNELDILLISSGTSLDNLFIYQADNPWLNKTCFLVGSQRLKHKLANIPRFQGEIRVTQDPSDKVVYEQLLEWAS